MIAATDKSYEFCGEWFSFVHRQARSRYSRLKLLLGEDSAGMDPTPRQERASFVLYGRLMHEERDTQDSHSHRRGQERASFAPYCTVKRQPRSHFFINTSSNMKFAQISSSTLGFPRMGPNRELKFALEKLWKGHLSEQELLNVAHSVEQSGWKLQQDGGVDHITVGDHYLYDMVLTWSEMFALCPKRFQHLHSGLSRMFAMARGVDGAEALSKCTT
eukprot:scaffold2830_cov131-Cylindrotheca_fusiformis.AAC.98